MKSLRLMVLPLILMFALFFAFSPLASAHSVATPAYKFKAPAHTLSPSYTQTIYNGSVLLNPTTGLAIQNVYVESSFYVSIMCADAGTFTAQYKITISTQRGSTLAPVPCDGQPHSFTYTIYSASIVTFQLNHDFHLVVMD